MRLKINFLLIFIILLSTSFIISDKYKNEAISNELKLSINDLKINYNIILHDYKVSADAIKYSILSFPEVKDIISNIDEETDEKQKAIYRKKLYETLKKDFQTYKKVGVNLILFTQADNKVFLRMHKPAIFGDDISNVRFSIETVNKKHQEVFGFEQGKISHAFRHVYPIYDDKKRYIGNIDISFSSERLQQSLDDAHKIHSHFLVSKDVIDSRVWSVQSVTTPYRLSIEHSNYMVTKRKDEQHKNMLISKKIISKNKKLIHNEIKNSKQFAIYGEKDGEILVISFLPIYSATSKERAHAYLVSYSYNTNISNIINEHIVIKISSGIVILFTLLLIYFLLLKRKEVLLASKVFSNMHDGAIITDANKKIIRVNDAFSNITQYSENEILGNYPNLIKSGWHDDEFYKKMWEEIVSEGNWHGEIVDRKKDGSVYTSETSIFSLKSKDGSVKNYIAILSDITHKKEQENIINNLAYYDVLTQLPNKIYFNDIFNTKISSAKRYDTKLAILFIDLDNFKSINDTYGHLAGDEFLKEASRRIKSVLREEDLLSRFGGDEFVIMIDKFKKTSDLGIVSEKIVKIFELPFSINEIEVYSGASIGISLYPDNGNTYDELVRTADTAMYHVKNSGKNGFKFFLEDMNQTTIKRMKIENALRTAVQNNELYLTYQPKIDLSTNKTYGMEALLRWENKDMGFISPELFIPISEENGTIYSIGLWVLKQALFDTKKLHNIGKMLVVSINISIVQLENENFIDDVNEIIKDIKIDKRYIEFEITETQVMKNLDVTIEILNKIVQNGISLAIDDFGTGYSSLSYLKRIPAKTIKIDKSFVLDIDKDEDDKEIILAIIQLSKTFNKDVIAEGSETKEHIEILYALGCKKVQGYYYSKPIKYNDFKEYIAI